MLLNYDLFLSPGIIQVMKTALEPEAAMFTSTCVCVCKLVLELMHY